MAQTLIELREQKAKAEAKLEEAKQEWKAKEAKLKTKLAEINNAIFQLEDGFFAKMARKVAEADPKFMAAIEAEIERQHLDTRVGEAGAVVAAREAKKQMKATVAATVQNSEKIPAVVLENVPDAMLQRKGLILPNVREYLVKNRFVRMRLHRRP